MRLLCALVLLAGLAPAGDLVHLRNGRVLKGRVVEESGDAIVVDLGGGRMTVPRARIRLVERGATSAPEPLTTVRDEWFLVLHRERVAGWRRVVHTERPGRTTVEERVVFFRDGGGVDVDTRRVEAADGEGRPVEFLLMESYDDRTEIVSGRKARGRWTVHVTRDGETRVRDLAGLGDDWVLPLPAWSRFLSDARPGESRTIEALDVRRLRPVTLVLRRDEDTAAPGPPSGRCRALRLDSEIVRARALFRPGRGSLSVELNGPTLVARRATRARVELARRAHAAPEPLAVRQAQRHPLQRRKKKARRVFHARAGLALTAPDAGWRAKQRAAERGRVLVLEKLGVFASFEVFCYPLPRTPGGEPAGLETCFQRALARLQLTATRVERTGPVVGRAVAGFEGRTAMLFVRHRDEDLRCRLTVARLPDRYVVLVAAAPRHRWRWAEPDFTKMTRSLEIVP